MTRTLTKEENVELAKADLQKPSTPIVPYSAIVKIKQHAPQPSSIGRLKRKLVNTCSHRQQSIDTEPRLVYEFSDDLIIVGTATRGYVVLDYVLGKRTAPVRLRDAVLSIDVALKARETHAELSTEED